MNQGPVDNMRRSMEGQHGGRAKLAEVVAVDERHDGKPVWQGVVHVFDLEGHPTAKRAYAWSSPYRGQHEAPVLRRAPPRAGQVGARRREGCYRGGAQGQPMTLTEAQKLVRDLDTLADSIRNDWVDLATKRLSIDDRDALRKHLQWCLTEMERLRQRIDPPSPSN